MFVKIPNAIVRRVNNGIELKNFDLMKINVNQSKINR